MDIQLFLMNLKRLESETAKLYDELAELSRRRFPELCLFLLDLADEERGHESYVDSLRRLLGSLEITERTDEEQEELDFSLFFDRLERARLSFQQKRETFLPKEIVEEIVSLESSLVERHALLLSERFELPQEVQRLLTALVSFDRGHEEKIKARAVRFGLSFQSE